MTMDLDQPHFQARPPTSSQKRTRDDLDLSGICHAQKVRNRIWKDYRVLVCSALFTNLKTLSPFLAPQRIKPFVAETKPSTLYTSSHPLGIQNKTITPVDSPSDAVSFAFPLQSHLERQRRELSPLSINTQVDHAEMQYDVEMPQEAPRPAPPPSQAFGPPWGPDYGVNQISDMNNDDNDNDMSNSNDYQAGTPLYDLSSMRNQIGQSFQNVQSRGAPWEQCERLPSPISESEISPTTRIFQEHNETVRWSDDVPVGALDDSHRDSSLGEGSKVSGSQQVFDNTQFSLAVGYRDDCEKCQRRVPGHYSHIVRS
ncbi:hypothetical protein KEM54_003520 [Ascosphaera aggregata]|nr:hypothetical protein KEM54_003520 [Ascosphaera aggregata]